MLIKLSFKHPEETSFSSKLFAQEPKVVTSPEAQVHCGIDSTERQVVIVLCTEHQTGRVTTA